MEFPSVVETNNDAQKHSHPNSPSITSGITGISLSTSAQGGPSYASVTAKQTPDPDMLELKRQFAELETTIQVQQQQLQQTTATPTPNPPASRSPMRMLFTVKQNCSTKQTTVPGNPTQRRMLFRRESKATRRHVTTIMVNQKMKM
jgi:hypothetical protein